MWVPTSQPAPESNVRFPSLFGSEPAVWASVAMALTASSTVGFGGSGSTTRWPAATSWMSMSFEPWPGTAGAAAGLVGFQLGLSMPSTGKSPCSVNDSRLPAASEGS